MYHQNQHQGKNTNSCSRIPMPSERHMFRQGGNGPGDSGLILSTDAKPRLKWTPDLHEKFVEAVNQLGGPDKATPKTIMKVMGISGLTLYHLKSHLQKYRLSKNVHGQANTGTNKICMVSMAGDKTLEENEIHTNTLSIGTQTNKSLPISEALQMQIEVQRRLHEQLEVQRHLQLRIEAQGKYLQAVLEKAEETLGKQNLGTVGLEAHNVQRPDQYMNPRSKQTQATYHADCSLDSCLTSCEGPQKDCGINNNRLGLRPYLDDSKVATEEEPLLQQTGLIWAEESKENRMFLSSMVNDEELRVSSSEIPASNLSIGVGDRGFKRTNEDYRFGAQEKRTKESKIKLDLNMRAENFAVSNSKQFDLNGFSWS